MSTTRFEMVSRLASLGLLVLLGGCVDGPDGTTPDPDPAPTEEPQPCDDGELWDDLLLRCVPGHCGTDRYPTPKDPDKARVHVDPGFEGGSNGTAQNPYRDVLEAAWNAGPDTAILLAAGTAEVDGFADLSQPGQELLGRCPELTVLRSHGSPRLLRVGQTRGVRVAGITFEGGPPNATPTPGEPLVELFNSADVVLSEITVRGASHDGILVWQSEDVVVERALVEGSTRAGISMTLSSQCTVRDSHVIATARDGADELGVGIWVEHAVSPAVLRNRVEDGGGPGVILTDTAWGRLSDNHVAGNAGAGIWAVYNQDLTIDNNVVDSNTGIGLAFHASSGDLRDNAISNTRSGADGHGGRGMDVLDAGPVSVERNVLEGNREAGLLFRLSEGVVRDNEVRDNTASDAGAGGRGIEIRDVAAVEITGNLVEGCEEAGIALFDATGTIEDNEVRDTLPGPATPDGYTFGHGIHVQSSTDVVTSNNVVVSSRYAGIVYLHTLRGVVHDNEVQDTAAGDGPWSSGDGVVIANVDEEITLQNNTVQGSARCGVLVDGGTLGWLEGNHITGNGRAVVGQQGAVLTLTDNEISGNGDDSVEQVPGPLLPLYEEFLAPIDGDD